MELASQFMPDKMVALNGTGDMYISGSGDMYIGSTKMLEIPMRTSGAGIDEVSESVIPVFGTGDGNISDLVTM